MRNCLVAQIYLPLFFSTFAGLHGAANEAACSHLSWLYRIKGAGQAAKISLTRKRYMARADAIPLPGNLSDREFVR
jgi:hypothetical protein